MIKETITYTDYDGNERTEDFWFHISKAELTKMELSTPGGLTAYLKRIISAKDGKTIMDTFEDLIFRSYGEKTPDGRRFVKSKELSEAFTQTEAYDVFFMKLVTDDKAAVDFVNGIVPADISSPEETDA